ncbi:MAG: hypothetical protein FWF26_03230 [Treponema sp.]|nr:hypothetical protein [Treponema sp.]
MVKDELIQRNPIRNLVKSIHGGLKPGELGIIASPTGIGKTSVLVQIALDKLMQGRKVIHISLNQHTDYILTWYKNIFDEYIRKKNIETEQDILEVIEKNRVLMRFNQEALTVDHLIRSLRAMISDGGFAAESVIVDGYKFSPADREKVSRLKEFAGELGLSIWFSCNVKDEPFYDSKNVPVIIKDYADLFDVIIVLEPKQESKKPAEPAYIELIISRNRDNDNPEFLASRLDPKTLLILEDNSR